MPKPSIIAAKPEGYTMDAMVGQVNGNAIYASAVFEPFSEQLAALGYTPADFSAATFYRPVGCTNCSRTGYKGRLALHEVMAVSEEIERMTVERESVSSITRVAIESGMRTLRVDGLAKAAQGITSLDEILRVVA
jgi:type IV pilus assembly protein PilB